MTGTWPLGWQVGDIEIGAQYGKGIGSISDTTLGGSAASVDITGIVSSYAHLMVLAYARSDAATTLATLNVRFNADSAANYDVQRLAAAAAVVTPVEGFTASAFEIGWMPAASGSANLFGVSAAFLPHYAGSSNNKAAVSVSSNKYGTSSGNMATILVGGFWRSSAAINRITFLPSTGNFVAGTRITILGLGA